MGVELLLFQRTYQNPFLLITAFSMSMSHRAGDCTVKLCSPFRGFRYRRRFRSCRNFGYRWLLGSCRNPRCCPAIVAALIAFCRMDVLLQPAVNLPFKCERRPCRFETRCRYHQHTHHGHRIFFPPFQEFNRFSQD